MNVNSTDYFPMQVNPANFSRGDVVKKIITDNVKTPYVGVVTSVVPQTNKVEVQWPSGVTLEDPWDLIKVNPFIEPPVVKQDKAYPTSYNERGKQQANSLKHYRVLEDFINEFMKPVIVKASSYYNEGMSKGEAFKSLSCEFDNKSVIEDVLYRVYASSYDHKRTADVIIDSELKTASLHLSGNSDEGFKLSYNLGNETTEEFYDNAVVAAENFNRVEEILATLNKKQDYASIVGSVSQRIKELKLESKDEI